MIFNSFKTVFIRDKVKFLRPIYLRLRKQKGAKGVNPQFAEQFYMNEPPFKVFSDLNKQLYFDTTTYGLEKLLRIADKNSMYHGVEVRLPYLFHELVEFVFSLPSNFKFNNGYSKYILRNMSNDLLPNEIVWRKQKVGYKSPIEEWSKNKRFMEVYVDAENKLMRKGILLSEHAFDPMKIIEINYFMQ